MELVELILPAEGDWVLVDLHQVLLQPRDPLHLELDPEMSEKDLPKFGKGDVEEIRPGAILGREDACEAVGARDQIPLPLPSGDGSHLLGDGGHPLGPDRDGSSPDDK